LSSVEIIVSRLLKIYDPWDMFRHNSVLNKEIVYEYIPQEYIPEEEREWNNVVDSAKNYDYGRIHFFANKSTCDPIDLEFIDYVLLDGHHRVMAWDLTKKETIPCNYSGNEDLLTYLTGASDIDPLEDTQSL